MSNNASYDYEEDVAIYEDDVWREYPTSIRVTATTAILITAIIGLGGKSHLFDTLFKYFLGPKKSDSVVGTLDVLLSKPDHFEINPRR